MLLLDELLLLELLVLAAALLLVDELLEEVLVLAAALLVLVDAEDFAA